jgi:CBS domain-containing protein
VPERDRRDGVVMADEQNISEVKEVHESLRNGSIFNITTKDPITLNPDSSILEVTRIMVDRGIRRVPVVDQNSNSLEGIITASDLIDFFGGGDKYKILQEESNGDLLEASKLPISKIMCKEVISFEESDSIKKAAETMLSKDIGGCPVVDKGKRLIGIVCESDFVKKVPESLGEHKVEEIMTKNVITVNPESSIAKASELMESKGVRRVPVVDKEEVVGMLRIMGILKYIDTRFSPSCNCSVMEDVLKVGKTKDIMSTYFVTIGPGDHVDDLIQMMIGRRMGGFPVEENGKLVGIVTEHDVFRFAYSK